MAVICRERRDAVRLHIWNPARCIGGCVAALGLLVPDVFEMLYDRTSLPFPWLSVAVAITALGCGPWTTLESDRRTGGLRWRRLAVWGVSHRHFEVGTGFAGELATWPTRGIIQRVILRLRRGECTVTVPLGWTWRGRLPDEWRRAVVTFAANAPISLPPELAAAEARRSRFQISLRRILLVTAVAAVCLALFARRTSWNDDLAPAIALGSFLLVAATLFYRPASAVSERFALCAAVIYLPFAWLVLDSYIWNDGIERFFRLALFFPSNYFAGLWVAIVPAFSSHGWGEWAAAAAVMLELMIGLWSARRGWKWTFACVSLLAVLSFLSSYIFHALLRV